MSIIIIWLEYYYQIQMGGVAMNIRPSAAIRQNYNEIGEMCRKTAEPVFLTKNGEGDLVVMDIETDNRREKMLKLREELYITPNKYHKMLIEKWHPVLYQIQDDTVYVEYILDCRKDYSWLIK